MKALIIILSLLISASSFTQNMGELKGKIIDKETGEPLPFVRIILEKNGATIGGTTTDFDGNYKIAPVSPDTVDIRVQFVGFDEILISDIYIRPDQITFQNLELETADETMDCVVVITREDIQSMPTRSASGIYSTVTGGIVNIRGARSNNTHYYEDQNTESYSKIESNKFKKVKNDPLSTFSIDVDKAAYSNTRRFITSGSLPPADAVRIEEMINYFQYDYAQPTDDTPFAIHTEYTECAWNKEHQLVRIGLKGKEIEMKDAPASNLVFLIDVSGSMQSADKLDFRVTHLDVENSRT